MLKKEITEWFWKQILWHEQKCGEYICLAKVMQSPEIRKSAEVRADYHADLANRIWSWMMEK